MRWISSFSVFFFSLLALTPSDTRSVDSTANVQIKEIWVVRDCIVNMISTLNPTPSE